MKANSLKDLGVLWMEKQKELETNKMESNLNRVTKTNSIKTKDSLTEKASTYKTPEVKVTFHINFKSILNKNHLFCNRLSVNKCIKEKSALEKIFATENKTCHPESLPFLIDQETLDIYPRHKAILREAGLYNNEKSNEISKGTYVDEVSRLNPSAAKSGQGIRIYFKHEEDIVEVILIDIYHMFATTRKEEVRKKYREVSGYNACMNTLRTCKRA